MCIEDLHMAECTVVMISTSANFGLIAIMESGHTPEKSKYSHWRKASIHTGEKQAFTPEQVFILEKKQVFTLEKSK